MFVVYKLFTMATKTHPTGGIQDAVIISTSPDIKRLLLFFTLFSYVELLHATKTHYFMVRNYTGALSLTVQPV